MLNYYFIGAQAAHELVPPEIIEPVLKTIANNFITERNSSDVMAIGDRRNFFLRFARNFNLLTFQKYSFASA